MNRRPEGRQTSILPHPTHKAIRRDSGSARERKTAKFQNMAGGRRLQPGVDTDSASSARPGRLLVPQDGNPGPASCILSGGLWFENIGTL